MLHLKSHFVLGLLMVRTELKLLEVCTMTVWTEGPGVGGGGGKPEGKRAARVGELEQVKKEVR